MLIYPWFVCHPAASRQSPVLGHMVSPEPEAGDRDGALRVASACASSARGAGDPWADIPPRGKLNDGATARILNAIHRQPRTIA